MSPTLSCPNHLILPSVSSSPFLFPFLDIHFRPPVTSQSGMENDICQGLRQGFSSPGVSKPPERKHHTFTASSLTRLRGHLTGFLWWSR